jgi:hypothetical protein
LRLAERVVAVTADHGPGVKSRYSYGSGCIVYGRTVLTAAHVVQGAQRVWVRRADITKFEASLDPDFTGDPGGWLPDGSAGPDLTLVTINDECVDLPRLGLARVDRDHPGGVLDRAQAVGYPWFGERKADGGKQEAAGEMRVQVPAPGQILLSPREDGLLDLHVTISPPRPPGGTNVPISQWAGMSGAPVFASGRLVGVVSEHAPRKGDASVAIVPLTALEPDSAHSLWGRGVANAAAWWQRLGAPLGQEGLVVLPPPDEAPYRATLRELGAALHARMPQLLGREWDLARIATFATGQENYMWLEGGRSPESPPWCTRQ